MGKTIKIGLLGSGTVGSGVVEVLKKNVDEISQKAGTEIEIKKIGDKRGILSPIRSFQIQKVVLKPLNTNLRHVPFRPF